MAALAGTGPCPPPSTATTTADSTSSTAELKAETPNMVMDSLRGDKEDTGEGNVRAQEVENAALLIKVDLPDGRPATGKLCCVSFIVLMIGFIGRYRFYFKEETENCNKSFGVVAG
jgi:hypothetical protein